MRYVLCGLLIMAVVVMIGCGGGEEQEATTVATLTVTATVEARETPTSTMAATGTPVATPEATPSPTQPPPIPTQEVPEATSVPTQQPPVPTLGENTLRLGSVLEMGPDGIGRYEGPSGSFRIIYFPGAGEEDDVDFIIYINEHPVREHADAVVEFIHSVGIADHCNPMLRIAWVGPETGPPFTKEDFPICVRG